MPQDFSKKMTILVRDDMASWQLTNTVAHIAAFLGNKMQDPFDTGEFFVSKDGVNFSRNSQFGIVALKASKEELKALELATRTSTLPRLVYVQEMIDHGDDAELETALAGVSSEDMDILGIGLFGPKDKLKALTGTFKLWK